MVGPYATVRLSDNVFWQSRAAWGRSSNTVSPFLAFTDSFTSTRWLATSGLTGRCSFSALTFSPSASVSYISDTSESYADTFGELIPAVTSSFGQVKAGPEISYRWDLGPGVTGEPRAAADLIWTVASDATGQTGVGTTGPGGLRGKVELGPKIGAASGVSADVSGSYDGIGPPGYSATTGSASLRVPLN